MAERHGKIEIGGSDAHTLASAGRTYTEVKGATTPAEFLQGLRQGRTRVFGEQGNCLKLTLAIWRIGYELMREKCWTGLFLPLMFAVPAITLGNYIREGAFERKWSRRLDLFPGTEINSESTEIVRQYDDV